MRISSNSKLKKIIMLGSGGLATLGGLAHAATLGCHFSYKYLTSNTTIYKYDSWSIDCYSGPGASSNPGDQTCICTVSPKQKAAAVQCYVKVYATMTGVKDIIHLPWNTTDVKLDDRPGVVPCIETP